MRPSSLGSAYFPTRPSKVVILAGGGSSSDFVAGTFQEDYLDLESQPLQSPELHTDSGLCSLEADCSRVPR